METRFIRYLIRFLYIVIFLLLLIAVPVVFDSINDSNEGRKPQEETKITDKTGQIDQTKKQPENETENGVEENIPVTSSGGGLILIDGVPFVSQAPYGNWGDVVYEEGCEEASMLIAVSWARGSELTPEIANSEIRKISDLEAQLFESYLDTSVYDTASAMRQYFSFDDYEIAEDITKADMINTLEDEKVIMAPIFGRALFNPYYTPPGPIAHMLVVYGYDPMKKEFITNDPGTKNGKALRFKEDVLFDAIWAYPTSSKELAPPMPEDREKTVIVVSKR